MVAHLKKQYLGPAEGDQEWMRNRPDATYLVGTLFPTDAERSDTFDSTSIGDDDALNDSDDEVIETANAYAPSSAAISFLILGQSIIAKVNFGTYIAERVDGVNGWRRVYQPSIEVPLTHTTRIVDFDSPLPWRVTSRWRKVGDGNLVTLAIENRSARSGDSYDSDECMFQVAMEVSSPEGRFLPYPSISRLDADEEEAELQLRYRKKEIFAVGHGTSATWSTVGEEGPLALRIDSLPTFEVPSIEARTSDDRVFELAFLSTISEAKGEVISELRRFVSEYDVWVGQLEDQRAGLAASDGPAAGRILGRAVRAAERMGKGIDRLEMDGIARTSFALSMVAMREQMRQTRRVARPAGSPHEPSWRPFQLGFILLSLPSAIDDDHDDRDLVDLIWFPTGGGKTEAYLALAAAVMVNRRLMRGPSGGGTAVITRYTLRLLTTQQFQRASTLICALELLRNSDPRLAGVSPFTIGLWLGNDTTPGSVKDAKNAFAETRKKRHPDNPFQLEACPWCGTRIMPLEYTENSAAYGVRDTADTIVLRCPSEECPFNHQLPVEVIDERIYDNPPSVLLATVDKFARLPFEPRASRLLGRNSNFDPPSLIIQDELHLLSGPLGTTVAVYEAAILGLIEYSGGRPKVVASTATIRGANEQVRGLFARDVSLYPPSGLDEEDSYLGKANLSAPGRLYVGLMPQAFTQSTSVVRALAPLLEAPMLLENATRGDLDAYWTVVAYHNSLRELGRTVTLVRDDVGNLMRARTDGGAQRELKGDGLVELTSRIEGDELPAALARLGRRYGSGGAVDVVASTNMLSVGIDVPRLAVMLMNGQPKTTSEYIQATSRVGRGEVPGIVVTLYRPSRPRDRSHFETFRAYHQSIYRFVEPTSVTPWSLASRRRSLAAALVAFVRNATPWGSNEGAADFDRDDSRVARIITLLEKVMIESEPDEASDSAVELTALVNEWNERTQIATAAGSDLVYRATKSTQTSLTRGFTQSGEGWPIMNSMRSVDRNVFIRVKGEDY